MARAKSLFEVGAAVGDGYSLTRVIGSGAMGTVFECTAPDGKRVALKALASPDGTKDSAERRARFVREAAICGHIGHPNVVPVIDHGVDMANDVPYLVMPLLDGEDLARVLERCGQLPPATAARVVLQACRGIAAAHEAGVVHRDVKPSNLFLVRERASDGSPSLTVKVADFGLAKVYDDAIESLTASGRFMGTPHYVSPEQATNAKRVDARTDVWSTAMTLYHAIAGAPAYASAKSFIALVLELTGSPGVPSVQARAPWTPPAIARAVHGALLRDLELRCPSIAELSLALEMALGFELSRAPLSPDEIRAPDASERARVEPLEPPPASWDDLLRA